MKKMVTTLILCLFALLILSNKIMAAASTGTIELEHEGVHAKLYRLGDFKNGDLDLAPDFKGLEPISQEAIEKDTDGILLNRFEDRIEKNNLKPVEEKVSDADKKLSFEQEKGLYLVRYEKYEDGTNIVTYKSSYLYLSAQNLTIKAKFEIQPKEELDELSIVKIWRDHQSQLRPDRIFVNLYCDGERVDWVEVSRANNWRARFSNLDPDKVYRVVEELPKGYEAYVDYDYNDKTVYITNHLKNGSGPSDDDDQDIDLDDKDKDKNAGLEQDQDKKDGGDNKKSPKNSDETTGTENQKQGKDQGHDVNDDKKNAKNIDALPQTGLLWWPVGVLIGLGILFIAIYIVKRRKSEE